jgi:hypothetical protein
LVPIYIWRILSRTEPDSTLIIALACLSLAFASFAIPNESMSFLTRYYVGGALTFFGLFIRLFGVTEKSWGHKKQKVARGVAKVILVRTVVVNLLFAFPAIVWIFVFFQTVQPNIGAFALVYCILPIVGAVVVGFFEYKSLYA